MTQSSPRPTERFSDRVDNYVRYRPHYGSAVVAVLAREIGLTPEWVIADVGSGTGLSSEPFLENGNTVYGVEPNAPMRAAGAAYLARFPNHIGVTGTAEATGLPAGCVDMALAGQAFHWFEPDATRREWQRILRPGGWAVLMWNERPPDDAPFFAEYEELARSYGVDYAHVASQGRSTEERLSPFYGDGGHGGASWLNPQETGYEGMEGRLLSASYAPLPGHPNCVPMLAALRVIFDRYAVDGRITIPYRTRVYWGKLT